MATATNRKSKKRPIKNHVYAEGLTAFVVGLVSFVLAYVALLWAFETGSLWVYLIMIILVVVAVKYMIRSLRTLFASVRAQVK